jgi:hypothetical protein
MAVDTIEGLRQRLDWLENKEVEKFSELEFQVEEILLYLNNSQIEDAEKTQILKELLKKRIKF